MHEQTGCILMTNGQHPPLKGQDYKKEKPRGRNNYHRRKKGEASDLKVTHLQQS